MPVERSLPTATRLSSGAGRLSTPTVDLGEIARYSVTIKWSPEDKRYVVILPEWHGQDWVHTYGATRVEAMKNAEAVLQLLAMTALMDGRHLPEPHTFA